MLHFLLAVHFVLAVLIILLILLQKHDSDGALGAGGGGAAGGMFSVRGQANLLTRSTAVLMTFFITNCLVLAKMVKTMPSKMSVIDRVNELPMEGDGTPLSGFLSKKKSEPAPVKTEPAKSAPAKSAPAQTAPARSAPAKPVPAQTVPARSAPAKPAGTPARLRRPAADANK